MLLLRFLVLLLFDRSVSSLISLDILGPMDREFNGTRQLETMRLILERTLVLERKLESPRPPPEYSREEMLERMMEGRKANGGLSRAGCEILLPRGSVPLSNGKLRFTHDPRIELSGFAGLLSLSHIYQLLAQNVKCPVAFVTAHPSFFHWKERQHMLSVFETLRKSSKQLDWIDVEGPHHVHMLSPELVYPALNKLTSQWEAAKGVSVNAQVVNN